MNIDTNEVLEAAGTKWNFLKFQPGLVGGHCIGVDPYYLSYKSSSLGYQPKLIIAGREINDNMGYFISNKVIRLMIDNEISIKNSKVLVLGFTFKENCPDIRNTRVIDIVIELKKYGCNVDVHDSCASFEEVKSSYNIELISDNAMNSNIYDAIILAVSHKNYESIDINKLKHDSTVIYDVKGSLNDKNIHRL
jgi:UDP-N-acetyl-D-galactosamine dehydrogenase